MILGSGLGGFTADIAIEYTLPYSEIPNFPVSNSVQGHQGALVFGTIQGKSSSNARPFSFYEGYDMKQVTFPVRE